MHHLVLDHIFNSRLTPHGPVELDEDEMSSWRKCSTPDRSTLRCTDNVPTFQPSQQLRHPYTNLEASTFVLDKRPNCICRREKRKEKDALNKELIGP